MQEQLGHVEELVHVVDPDDARLPQQGIEGFTGCLRAADHVPGRDAIPAGAGFHHDDGLLGRQPPRDAGELTSVAHALQVEANHSRAGIFLPVLHAIVARYVGAVAGRYKARYS